MLFVTVFKKYLSVFRSRGQHSRIGQQMHGLSCRTLTAVKEPYLVSEHLSDILFGKRKVRTAEHDKIDLFFVKRRKKTFKVVLYFLCSEPIWLRCAFA